MSLNIPVPPFISNVTSQGFKVTVVPDGNPTGTFYSYQVIFNGTGGFLNAQGIITPVQQWVNATMIDVTGLTPGINYSVRLAAAIDNIGTNATAWGTVSSVTTLTGVTSPFAGQFTSAEQQVIQQSRLLMPEIFSRNSPDFKILAFAGVVLADINQWPPYGNLTFDSIVNDPNVANLVYFGISVMAEMFFCMRASLEDFQYNDNGLSLNVDQVGKINSAIANMLAFYRTMIQNYKKNQILVAQVQGLGTPRYQSQIGQFLKIALGSAFTWNSPS
jgi:hypothetical protein